MKVSTPLPDAVPQFGAALKLKLSGTAAQAHLRMRHSRLVWRRIGRWLLFPESTNEQFADGYAQAIKSLRTR